MNLGRSLPSYVVSIPYSILVSSTSMDNAHCIITSSCAGSCQHYHFDIRTKGLLAPQTAPVTKRCLEDHEPCDDPFRLKGIRPPSRRSLGRAVTYAYESVSIAHRTTKCWCGLLSLTYQLVSFSMSNIPARIHY